MSRETKSYPVIAESKHLKLKCPIYFATMAYSHDGNKSSFIIDREDDPIITLPYPPKTSAFDLFDALR